MNQETSKSWTARVYEAAYLLFLAGITFAGFLNTTMIRFRFTEETLLPISAGLAVVILFGLVTRAIPWKNGWFFCSLAIAACLLLSWRETHHRFIMELALLIIGAVGVSFRKIVITYLGVSVPFLLVTVVLAMTGVIENLVYYRGSANVQDRMSFGSIYPTDFCAHIFFLACCWVWVRYRKITYFELLVILVLAAFCYIFCDARTALICLGTLAFLTGFIKITGIDRDDSGGPAKEWLKKIFSTVMLAGTILPCLVSIGMSWFYDAENPLFSKMNLLLSDRLRLGRVGFDRYSPKAFGQIVEMKGNGGHVVYIPDYFFLDSSYIYILLCLGWVTLIAVMVILVVSGWRLWKLQKILMLSILALVCVQCLMEQHLITIGYHPFLLLLTALPDYGQNLKGGENAESRTAENDSGSGI